MEEELSESLSMERDTCPIEPPLKELTNTLQVLTVQLSKTNEFYKDSQDWSRQIIRGLLTVICIIALGNSAIDLAKKAIGSAVFSAIAETAK